MTIQFLFRSLKDDQKYMYEGDRTREEIVKFALRLSGPAVQEITKTQSFDTIKRERDLYFLYVGDKSGVLWVSPIRNFVTYRGGSKFTFMCLYLMNAGTLSQDCKYISSACIFLSISSERRE